jgi:hypothetical protein
VQSEALLQAGAVLVRVQAVQLLLALLAMP